MLFRSFGNVDLDAASKPPSECGTCGQPATKGHACIESDRADNAISKPPSDGACRTCNGDRHHHYHIAGKWQPHYSCCQGCPDCTPTPRREPMINYEKGGRWLYEYCTQGFNHSVTPWDARTQRDRDCWIVDAKRIVDAALDGEV